MASEVLEAEVVEVEKVEPVGAKVEPGAEKPGAAEAEAVAEAAAKVEADGDWRTRLSGGDEKLLGFLGRYQSEKAVIEQVKKHNDDIKSGKYLKPLGDEPTDEELAAYRADHGIPEKPEGYMEKLPEGTVVGDDDKPYFETFFEKMHAANAPPGMANAAIASYLEIVEEQQAGQLEAVAVAKKECEDVLREEWATPGEYRRMDNILQNYVGSLPEPIRDAFDKGTGPDGLPLGYNPEIRRWLVARALEENPLATVVPGAGAHQASAIADEKAALEKRMRDDRTAYFKDAKAQARYLELTEAQNKMAERGG